MPSASILLRSSSTPFLHIHRPHHPSEHAMSHPWDTHQCHVKHPPAMQAPLRLTASPRASCTAGSNPAELLVVAGSSASARDQPFEAPQCQTFSPAHPHCKQAAWPPHCTAPGKPRGFAWLRDTSPKGNRRCAGRGDSWQTTAPSRGEEPGAGQAWKFYTGESQADRMSPKEAFQAAPPWGEHTVKNTNNHIKK